jgi:hypothetical protein
MQHKKEAAQMAEEKLNVARCIMSLKKRKKERTSAEGMRDTKQEGKPLGTGLSRPNTAGPLGSRATGAGDWPSLTLLRRGADSIIRALLLALPAGEGAARLLLGLLEIRHHGRGGIHLGLVEASTGAHTHGGAGRGRGGYGGLGRRSGQVVLGVVLHVRGLVLVVRLIILAGSREEHTGLDRGTSERLDAGQEVVGVGVHQIRTSSQQTQVLIIVVSLLAELVENLLSAAVETALEDIEQGTGGR